MLARRGQSLSNGGSKMSFNWLSLGSKCVRLFHKDGRMSTIYSVFANLSFEKDRFRRATIGIWVKPRDLSTSPHTPVPDSIPRFLNIRDCQRTVSVRNVHLKISLSYSPASQGTLKGNWQQRKIILPWTCSITRIHSLSLRRFPIFMKTITCEGELEFGGHVPQFALKIASNNYSITFRIKDPLSLWLVSRPSPIRVVLLTLFRFTAHTKWRNDELKEARSPSFLWIDCQKIQRACMIVHDTFPSTDNWVTHWIRFPLSIQQGHYSHHWIRVPSSHRGIVSLKREAIFSADFTLAWQYFPMFCLMFRIMNTVRSQNPSSVNDNEGAES